MSFPEVVFTIIEEIKCPLYKAGDDFKLSGKTHLVEDKNQKKFISTAVIKTPRNKSVCRTFFADLTSVLIKYGSVDKIPGLVMNCSGCTGVVRLEYKEKKLADHKPVRTKIDKDIGIATKLLTKFPIFQTLDEVDIKKLVPMLKLKKYAKDTCIIKKGDAGSNLFLLLSGKAEVLVDEKTSIGFMGRGEVFGEISLLIGTPAGATIKVVDMVTVLLIYGKDFKKLLNMFPSLQMYFAHLLAQRLSKTNVERSEEFASGMIGKLSENPPTELFQTLNLNHKTGVLTLSVSKGTGYLFFREGLLVGSEYNGADGKEGFFELLNERDGRFKFTPGLDKKYAKAPEIGDFMWLLMEGARRIDEG
ncbi:DUF4388 domain-containing protein [Desulfobacterales bacterium HSG16]|nr:DUF4388 domain-containing protein [Desulfobacterales bacterium HSG16]